MKEISTKTFMEDIGGQIYEERKKDQSDHRDISLEALTVND